MLSRKVRSLRVFAPAGRGYARGNVICSSVFGDETKKGPKYLHQMATKTALETMGNLDTQELYQQEPDFGSILPDILSDIGRTPLVKINKIAQEEGIKCDLLAKCEYRNPGGSLKDRVAVRMILEAEKEGKIRPGMTLIEPTSGNTGIAIALAGSVLGYKCILCITDKMSKEKADTMRALGATVLRANKLAHEDSPDSHIGLARRLNQIIPDSYILNQYDNQMNPQEHYDSTAQEIIDACNGQIDVIVVGAGTCGTLTGVARKMKDCLPYVKVVAVDPEGSLLTPGSDPTCLTPFLVEGIGHKFFPGVYDSSVVDEWIKIRDEESFNMARRIIRSEGMLIGGSSGAVMFAALQEAKKLNKNQRCVAILPDGIRNYLTHFVSDEWMEKQKFAIYPIKGEEWRFRPISEKLIMPMFTPPSLNITVEKAIQELKRRDVPFIVMQNENGQCTGMATLANLDFGVKAGKINPTACVTEIMCTNYGIINPNNTTYGRVSDLFTKHPYVIVSKDEIGSSLAANQIAGIIDPEIFFQNL